jgi:hypothetical protein
LPHAPPLQVRNLIVHLQRQHIREASLTSTMALRLSPSPPI